MPHKHISIKLNSEDGVRASSFIDTTGKSYYILKDLEKMLRDDSESSVNWVISELRSGSTLVEFAPADHSDFTEHVMGTFIGSLETIENEVTYPEYFDDELLNRAKQLVQDMGRTVSEVTVESNERSVSLTQRLAANVDELLRTRYHALGSIEGELRMVTLQSGQYCNVYEFIHGNAIRCYFNDDMLSEVKDNLGNRVLAYGTIKYGRKGNPKSIELSDLRPLRASDQLPSADDIFGIDPDFTGGMLSEDYIATLYDE